MLVSTGCSKHSPLQHWLSQASLSNKGVQSSLIFMRLTAEHSLCQMLSGNPDKMLPNEIFYSLAFSKHCQWSITRERNTYNLQSSTEIALA